MPIISVQLAAKPDPKLTRAIAQSVTDLTAKLLRKDNTVTSVAVQYVDQADWFIDGESLEQLGFNSFFVDARITDGTNTKAEKSAYIRAVFESVRRILGGAHPISYVHADDVRADGYGFGGLTQEHRANSPSAAVA